MSTTFSLDERLARDCLRLAELPLCDLLLMNNALIPWFILVPRVNETELHELAPSRQQTLFDEITLISRFAERTFAPDKLNVAAIGNIVRQLHIHVVARREDDPCWPGVVWGMTRREAYTQSALDTLTRQLRAFLPPGISIHHVTSTA